MPPTHEKNGDVLPIGPAFLPSGLETPRFELDNSRKSPSKHGNSVGEQDLNS